VAGWAFSQQYRLSQMCLQMTRQEIVHFSSHACKEIVCGNTSAAQIIIEDVCTRALNVQWPAKWSEGAGEVGAMAATLCSRPALACAHARCRYARMFYCYLRLGYYSRLCPCQVGRELFQATVSAADISESGGLDMHRCLLDAPDLGV
jgi:hypothetical protein